MNNETNGDEIRSIARSAKILVCLSMGINTLSEISDHCNYSMPTVHRLLKALEKSGFARKDPLTKKHYVGPLIDKIHSFPQVTHQHLIACSVKDMQQVAEISGETVNLTVRLGIEYLPVYSIESKNDLRIHEEIKILTPVFVGPTAKVLLSQSSDEEVEKLLKYIKLEKITENTITDQAVFLSKIKQAREQGYSISYGEKVVGAIGSAAPIKNYHLPASLSILGPEYRLRDRIPELVKKLIESADRISHNIASY
jgi:IclR family transcriptional regulator, KDG regulon repressor